MTPTGEGGLIVVVTGGREFRDKSALWWALDVLHRRGPITFLSLGDARGADALALAWAHERGVHGVKHLAHWDRLGKAAGHERNGRMIASAIARGLETGEPVKLLAAPGGRGTADCVAQARERGVLVEDLDALLQDEVGDFDNDRDPPPRDWGDL